MCVRKAARDPVRSTPRNAHLECECKHTRAHGRLCICVRRGIWRRSGCLCFCCRDDGGSHGREALAPNLLSAQLRRACGWPSRRGAADASAARRSRQARRHGGGGGLLCSSLAIRLCSRHGGRGRLVLAFQRLFLVHSCRGRSFVAHGLVASLHIHARRRRWHLKLAVWAGVIAHGRADMLPLFHGRPRFLRRAVAHQHLAPAVVQARAFPKIDNVETIRTPRNGVSDFEVEPLDPTRRVISILAEDVANATVRGVRHAA